MLQGKIKEQETRRRQLEEELEDMRRKHAESEAQWKERISFMNMESKDGERKERLDTRDVQGKLNSPYYDKERPGKEGEDQDKFNSSYYDKERRDRGEDRANVRNSYHDKERKTRHRTSDESPQFDEARHKSQSSDLSYRDEIEGRHSRNRRHASDSSRRVETEGRRRDLREESPRRGQAGSRKGHEKSERKSRKSRESNVEFETAIKKTEAEVTKVQVVRDDEVYRLSKGRIELLESEKSALMELNTSLQEENKALKQLALSLQKGTG